MVKCSEQIQSSVFKSKLQTYQRQTSRWVEASLGSPLELGTDSVTLRYSERSQETHKEDRLHNAIKKDNCSTQKRQVIIFKETRSLKSF